jgi:putative membrane protein
MQIGMMNERGGITLFLSAAMLLAGATARAQAPGQAQPPGGMSPQQQPRGAQETTPGMNNLGQPASPADQAFVREEMERDATEAQLGQLAQQKAESPDVKQLAEKMVETRTNLDKQLAPIAKGLNVDQPREPSKKGKQLIAKLEALSGPQFEEEYLRTVVKDHQQDVKDFKAESGAAQDPTLQQAARQDEGVFQSQLQIIEQIAQKHNVTMAEAK